MLLALIAAGGLAAFGLVAARRHTHSEVLAAEPPGPQRLRRASEAVAGAVGPRHQPAAALAPAPADPTEATAEDTATAEPVPAGPAPERIERVKALQRQLSWLGFEPGIVDGRYGPLTTGAVKRFQEARDLPVDGVVGQGTGDALRASLAQRPSSDRIDRVKALQRQLSWLGYEPGPVDGRYGPLTTAAVARFQDSYELPADGVVDQVTQRALQRSLMNSDRS